MEQQGGDGEMVFTKRKPDSVGTILVEEFLEPMNISQTQLAEVSGLPRKHINELCRDRREVTADTALILSRVFGNSADFWLNTQRRNDIWNVMNDKHRLARVERAVPIPISRPAEMPKAAARRPVAQAATFAMKRAHK